MLLATSSSFSHHLIGFLSSLTALDLSHHQHLGIQQQSGLDYSTSRLSCKYHKEYISNFQVKMTKQKTKEEIGGQNILFFLIKTHSHPQVGHCVISCELSKLF